jgi:hypothetical protein
MVFSAVAMGMPNTAALPLPATVRSNTAPVVAMLVPVTMANVSVL